MTKLKKPNINESAFPNLEILGYYAPFQQYIRLNKISITDIEALRNEPKRASNVKLIKLLAHELRHWIDHISTLWGQASIVEIYNSMSIRHHNKIELFPSLVQFIRNNKRGDFNDYFKVISSTKKINNEKERWIYQYSTGCRFDTKGKIDNLKPILFVNFFSALDNKHIARVPVSIDSLLETNAVFEELRIKASSLHNLEYVEKTIENKLFEAEFLINHLYNPSLTLYSVAVHILANSFSITDASIAYELSSKIATICLNMPHKYYESISVSNRNIEWGDRNLYFLKNKDIGYLYFILIQNYSSVYKETNEFNIDTLLNCSGLPSSKQIEKDILEEFDSLASQFIESEFSSRGNRLLKIGKELFKKRGITGDKINAISILNDKKYYPDLILDEIDNTINWEFYMEDVYNFKEDYKDVKFPEWYLITDILYSQIVEFYDICGV